MLNRMYVVVMSKAQYSFTIQTEVSAPLVYQVGNFGGVDRVLSPPRAFDQISLS
jgi:hypothetical protein